MGAGAVAVRLLVGAHRELGDVGLGAVLGHLQHDVDATGAPVAPPVERHVRRVGDEVGLPDALLVELARAAEVVVLGVEAPLEVGVRVEHEVQVVEEAHHGRRGGDRDVAGRLLAAAVEVLVPGIERDGEEAAGVPLEGLLVVIVDPDVRRAPPRDDVAELLVHVVLRLGLAAGADLDHVRVVGQVVVRYVDDDAAAALALPRPQLDRAEVLEGEVHDDADALPLLPAGVAVTRGVLVEIIRRGLGDLPVRAPHDHRAASCHFALAAAYSKRAGRSNDRPGRTSRRPAG